MKRDYIGKQWQALKRGERDPYEPMLKFRQDAVGRLVQYRCFVCEATCFRRKRERRVLCLYCARRIGEPS